MDTVHYTVVHRYSKYLLSTGTLLSFQIAYLTTIKVAGFLSKCSMNSYVRNRCHKTYKSSECYAIQKYCRNTSV